MSMRMRMRMRMSLSFVILIYIAILVDSYFIFFLFFFYFLHNIKMSCYSLTSYSSRPCGIGMLLKDILWQQVICVDIHFDRNSYLC